MGFSKMMGDLTLSTKRHLPEIKFICGVISLGALLYSTHKAALKSAKIIEKKKESLGSIETAKEMAENGDLPKGEEYTIEDEKMDRRKINLEFAIDMTKNYALPAGLTVATVWFFHGAMKDYKNLALGLNAAYNALLMKHNDTMKYIKDKLGDEKFNELEEGFKSEKIVNAQSTGLSDKSEKLEERNKANPYSRFFDECHPAWTDNPEINKMWLLGKQNELEERLHRVGHLYLNEAYDYCGFEPTQAGQVMGWVSKNPDGTLNHVDFGIFNIHDTASRWFVNGLEPVFLIDFNVDDQPITGRVGWAKY